MESCPEESRRGQKDCCEETATVSIYSQRRRGRGRGAAILASYIASIKTILHRQQKLASSHIPIQACVSRAAFSPPGQEVAAQSARTASYLKVDAFLRTRCSGSSFCSDF